MADLKAIVDNVIKGRMDKNSTMPSEMKGQPGVKELVQAAVDEGVEVGKILNEGLIAGMAVVGERFKNNEFYIPEVLIAARAMHAGMDILQPLLEKAEVEPLARVAIGTVKGDLHDIGKNLVAMMLKGAGFRVNDLGIDVSPEKFVQVAREGEQVLCLSALLTTTMSAMKTIVETLQKEGLRGKVKTMIGGAPVTQNYADEIGADGYAADASSAVDKVKELLGLS